MEYAVVMPPWAYRVYRVMMAYIRLYGSEPLPRTSIWYDREVDRGVRIRVWSSEDSSRRILHDFLWYNESIDRHGEIDLQSTLEQLIGALNDDTPKEEIYPIRRRLGGDEYRGSPRTDPT